MKYFIKALVLFSLLSFSPVCLKADLDDDTIARFLEKLKEIDRPIVLYFSAMIILRIASEIALSERNSWKDCFDIFLSLRKKYANQFVIVSLSMLFPDTVSREFCLLWYSNSLLMKGLASSVAILLGSFILTILAYVPYKKFFTPEKRTEFKQRCKLILRKFSEFCTFSGRVSEA